MNNLIIGDTSQLNFYLPNEYHRISSRNIDYDLVRNGEYDTIFLLFAEQRTFLNEPESFFTKINVDYTMEVIEEIKDYCKKIVVYSTSELWNNAEGEVSISDKFSYNYTPYIKSKEILCDTINESREKYDNVKIIYPFNFNSPYRKEGFLFSKIFDSVINGSINEVGNINFTRDIIHPSIIAKESIKSTGDMLIGTGELINVENFICDLFNYFGLDAKRFIIFRKEYELKTVRKQYYSSIKYSDYNELLKLTINDIRKNKFS